jgi:hypothetical protein
MAQCHPPIPGTSHADVLADIERGPRRSFLTWLRLFLAGQTAPTRH